LRIVLDTNVLIAALMADGLCRDLVCRGVLTHDFCTSEVLLNELADTLHRKFGVTANDVLWLVEHRARATIVKPAALPTPICRDSDDDVVLATAIAAQAQVIVTGDNDLLSLRKYEGISILSPRQFLEHLDRVK
jgi:putative PIN family toxin of toxin-antitoxin system